MLDLAMLAFIVVGFLLLIGYAKLCIRLVPVEISDKDDKA